MWLGGKTYERGRKLVRPGPELGQWTRHSRPHAAGPHTSSPHERAKARAAGPHRPRPEQPATRLTRSSPPQDHHPAPGGEAEDGSPEGEGFPRLVPGEVRVSTPRPSSRAAPATLRLCRRPHSGPWSLSLSLDPGHFFLCALMLGTLPFRANVNWGCLRSPVFLLMLPKSWGLAGRVWRRHVEGTCRARVAACLTPLRLGCAAAGPAGREDSELEKHGVGKCEAAYTERTEVPRSPP